MCIGVLQYRVQIGIHGALDRLEARLIYDALCDSELVDDKPEMQRKVSRMLERQLSRLRSAEEDQNLGRTTSLGIIRSQPDHGMNSMHPTVSICTDCDVCFAKEKPIFALDWESPGFSLLPPFGASGLTRNSSIISQVSQSSAEDSHESHHHPHCNKNLKTNHNWLQSSNSLKPDEWHPAEFPPIEEADENQTTLNAISGAGMLKIMK